jgi:pyruvate,orthophosphate dikinase
MGHSIAVDDSPALTDACLRIVTGKGRTTADAVAAALHVPPETIVSHLDAIAGAGLIEANGERLKATPAGRERVDALYAEERTQCQAAVEEALERFHPVNDAFKEVVTAWQLRTVAGEPVPNDHSDADYDTAVLRRLRDEIHAGIVPVVEQAGAGLARLGHYRDRLDAALARIDKGEHEYIAHPLKESYHTVWFELHEELIRLSGRNRSAEAAAGRA